MSKWSDYVYYDESSPSGLRWNVGRGNHAVKDGVVGTLDKQGRWSFVLTAFGVKKRRYCHRVIWEIFNGEIPSNRVVDHIDGKPHNNVIKNLRVVEQKINQRNACKSTRNKTGLTGVCRIEVICPKSGVFAYWVANWKDLQGKRRNRHFSVVKLGEEAAKSAATQFREKAIEQLNAEGAGYTERHGS